MSRDVKTPGESVAGVSSVQESRLERDVLAMPCADAVGGRRRIECSPATMARWTGAAAGRAWLRARATAGPWLRWSTGWGRGGLEQTAPEPTGDRT